MSRRITNPKISVCLVLDVDNTLVECAKMVMDTIAKKFRFSILYRSVTMEDVLKHNGANILKASDFVMLGMTKPDVLMEICQMLRGISYFNHVLSFPPLNDMAKLKNKYVEPSVDFVVLSEMCEDIRYDDSNTKYFRNSSHFPLIYEQAIDIAAKRGGHIANVVGFRNDALTKTWNRECEAKIMSDSGSTLTHLPMQSIYENFTKLDVVLLEFAKNELLQYTLGLDLYGQEMISFNCRNLCASDSLVASNENLLPEYMNPIGLFLAIAFRMEYFCDMKKEGAWLRRAINQALEAGFRTMDLYKGEGTLVTTKEMTREICEILKQNRKKAAVEEHGK